MSEVVFLNGAFVPKEEARISPDDRGFHFADGVYEVVKYYAGTPFRLDDHLQRLQRSLSEVKIVYPGAADLGTVFMELLVRNQLHRCDAGVYVQVSRGTHPRIHHFPAEITPTVYAFAFEFPSFAGKLRDGISVAVSEDIRWMRCDIKSVALLPNTMIYQQAVECGAGECILVRNGVVTEATHSSVLGVKNGKVITHPLNNLILPGITRKVILEICGELSIPVEERQMQEAELYTLDELIIAGTGSEVMPAVAVAGRPVGNGSPGPVTRLIQHHFFARTGSELPDWNGKKG